MKVNITLDESYVHKFVSDTKGIIHFGFVERIPRYMIESIKELKEHV